MLFYFSDMIILKGSEISWQMWRNVTGTIQFTRNSKFKRLRISLNVLERIETPTQILQWCLLCKNELISFLFSLFLLLISNWQIMRLQKIVWTQKGMAIKIPLKIGIFWRSYKTNLFYKLFISRHKTHC